MATEPSLDERGADFVRPISGTVRPRLAKAVSQRD